MHAARALPKQPRTRTRNAISPYYPRHTSSQQLPTPCRSLLHTALMGDNSPWIPNVSVNLTSRDRLSFHGCLYREQPWKTEIISPIGQRQVCSLCSEIQMSPSGAKIGLLVGHCRRFGSPQLGVP